MQRNISHAKTPHIKMFFLLVGITPIILLAFLWNNFALQGPQAILMISAAAAHLVACCWYASQVSIVVFDESYLFLQTNNKEKKIRLEHITSIMPINMSFPVGWGKIYPVTIQYTENGHIRTVRFLSKIVGLADKSEAIPHLKLLRHLVTLRKQT